MEHQQVLSFATYNLHGFKQGSSYLVDLCNNNDVVLIQEHWLAAFDLHKLDDLCNTMLCFSSSALDNAISRGHLRGRPYGGVAIYVKLALAQCTRLITASERYIIIMMNDVLVINVYLPCDNAEFAQERYIECLASIVNDISELQYKDIIVGGDFNTDFTIGYAMKSYLLNFANDLGIAFVDDKLSTDISRFTFRIESTGAGACIDHFAVSQSLYNRVMRVTIEDSGINLSDHCPVLMDVRMSLTVPTTTPQCVKQQQKQQLYFRWDKSDVWHYYMVTHDKLSTVHVPTHLLSYVTSTEDAHYSINKFYSDIVQCLWDSSVATIPMRKKNFYKFWWDEELQLMKEQAMLSYTIWKNSGKARSGQEFKDMHTDKLRYKAMIKSKESMSINQFSDSLNDALLNKDMTAFWNTWRSKMGRNKSSPTIDGQCNEKSIADRFATVFSATCIPNSETRHTELFQEFKSRFTHYDHTDACTNRVTPELLETHIAQLKRGKAPGYDGLTAEHITHAHPILYVLLSLLFNMLYIYGVVPDDFGVGIAVPLVKKMDGDKTTSDNYRCITLSPIISKLFELVLLHLFSTQLQSDHLQFGFKQKSSCSQAIFTMRTVVEHYTNIGSTVTLCSLDISKAFDRVDHYALLLLLMDKRLPSNFIAIFYNWFLNCKIFVRWGSALSFSFSVRAGVRQGGVLSPILFSIYIDVLIARLKSAKVGCMLLDSYYGCLLYADDIVLLAHTLNGMQQMLNICTEYGIEYDVKFNDTKSCTIRIGPRFNFVCAPLELAGKCLQFVDSVKYLGVRIVAGRCFKCSFEEVKMKFFRVFNCIYARSKAANSEIITVELMKSYCLPYVTYACEALPFNKTDINNLDNLINRALCRIFNVHTSESITSLRNYLGLSRMSVTIERRRLRFMDRLIGIEHFRPVLQSVIWS